MNINFHVQARSLHTLFALEPIQFCLLRLAVVRTRTTDRISAPAVAETAKKRRKRNYNDMINWCDFLPYMVYDIPITVRLPIDDCMADKKKERKNPLICPSGCTKCRVNNSINPIIEIDRRQPKRLIFVSHIFMLLHCSKITMSRSSVYLTPCKHENLR